jgi:hypothetical protein
VVAEDELSGQLLGDRGGVRLDVAPPVGLGEILEEARLEPLVRVEDEDG